MFIKAGDSETKEGPRIEEAIGEQQERAWVVFRFGSPEKLKEKVSKGRAAFSSLGSQRKGGLGDRIRRLAWDKLPLPTAPLAASLMGTLRV